MGIFDFWRKKEEKPQGLIYAPTMNGGTPFYAPFGDSVYASDIVVQSIRCKANEFKKLDPRHIRITDGKQAVVNDSSIARCLRRPNDFMTTADFLEKITILLELNKNVFIYPTYYMSNARKKEFTGLYPLKPSTVEYKADSKGVLYIGLTFANGYSITLPASDVIHWRKDYGVNDYFGGNQFGGDDNTGLLTMLKRYDMLTQSIAKALKCSCQINGIAKINTYADKEGEEEKRKEFEEKVANNESGILFTDNKLDYTHLPRDIKLVDSETLKFFYDTILRANGTSLAILNGDYSKQQKEAYYEHALEGDIISLGQAFSKCIFSDRAEAFGNEIVFYPNDITFMTMENKIAYMQVAVPAGALNKNQILKLGGFPPVEGGDEIYPRGFNSLDKTQEKEGTSSVDNKEVTTDE